MRPARAALLGAVQGVSELLPVSSSAHLLLLRGEEGDKALDVALHAGSLLAVGLRWRSVRLPAVRVLVAASVPPAVVGFVLEDWIERRLSGPRAVACGLVAGAAALAWADARGLTPHGANAEGLTPHGGANAEGLHGGANAEGLTPHGEPRVAGVRDGVVLGVAQAAALAPGVSRLGATLAAARALGFERREALALATAVGLPVVGGASGLKAVRLAQRRPRPAVAPLVAGFGAAAAAGVAAAPLTRTLERPLWPWAAYRLALAAAVARRG